MDLQDLKARVRDRTGIDVEARYEEFAKDASSRDPDLFLEWLLIRGHLGEDDFAALQANGGIEVTPVETLLESGVGRTRGWTRRIAAGEVPPIETAGPQQVEERLSAMILERGIATDEALAGWKAEREEATAGGKTAPSLAQWLIRGGHLDSRGLAALLREIAGESGADAAPELLLLGRVGEGGGGEILVARDPLLRRKVAYKKSHPSIAGDRRLAQLFLGEVQVTAQLDHPSVVPVYGIEVAPDGALAYTMKLVHGTTLRSLLARARAAGPDAEDAYPLPRRLEHFLRVADAIAYAHSRGVLHRDLKPANVMIGRFGEVYVLDWGLALRLGDAVEAVAELAERVACEGKEASVERTGTGYAIGTPQYMAPEQARGEALTPRADVYALGLLLHEMIAFRPAYEGRNVPEILAQARVGHRAALPKGTPLELVAILEKACEFEPAARYAGARELADDVRRHLAGEAPLARPDGLVSGTLRWFGRHLAAAMAAVLFVLLASALIGVGSLVRDARRQAEARERERELGRFLSVVGTRGHRIDKYFLRFESELEGIAAAAETALAGGEAASAPYWTDADFRPPDLAFSERYGREVSFGWPVFRPGPGLSEPDAHPAILKLAGAAGRLRGAFRSEDGSSRMRTEGVHVVWAYVGLESGLHCAYPGKGGYPADFDPRTRPWYVAARERGDLVWLGPYADATGQGLLLTCSRAIRAADGSIAGVAGLDLAIGELHSTLLALPDEPLVEGVYVLDREGRVVVGEGLAGAPSDPGKPVVGPPFPEQAVADAVRAGEVGVVALEGTLPRRIAVLHRLEALGWHYVVVARTPD